MAVILAGFGRQLLINQDEHIQTKQNKQKSNNPTTLEHEMTWALDRKISDSI